VPEVAVEASLFSTSRCVTSDPEAGTPITPVFAPIDQALLVQAHARPPPTALFRPGSRVKRHAFPVQREVAHRRKLTHDRAAAACLPAQAPLAQKASRAEVRPCCRPSALILLLQDRLQHRNRAMVSGRSEQKHVLPCKRWKRTIVSDQGRLEAVAHGAGCRHIRRRDQPR